MDFISAHLTECPHCRGEYQSLLDTKRLLASLAHRASRAEIEALLQSEADNRDAGSGSPGVLWGVLRPKPLTATVVLSFAGLCIASVSLDRPADGVSPGSGGISSPMSAAMVPGLGARSLRYLNEAVHSGGASAVLVPENMDGLVMDSGTHYSLSSSGTTLRHRHSISLSNVISRATARATDGRHHTLLPAGTVYPASTSVVDPVMYGGASRYFGTRSDSTYRVRSMAPDRLR
jgi:hypothetical protein